MCLKGWSLTDFVVLGGNELRIWCNSGAACGYSYSKNVIIVVEEARGFVVLRRGSYMIFEKASSGKFKKLVEIFQKYFRLTLNYKTLELSLDCWNFFKFRKTERAINTICTA